MKKYTKKAQTRGFSSKSIFKIVYINTKYKLIKKNDIVLDLGCVPGSWSQYITKKNYPNGFVIGVDIIKIKGNLKRFIFIKSNIKDLNNTILIQKIQILTNMKKKFFDVIFSDVAVNTTGLKNIDSYNNIKIIITILNIIQTTLKKNGNSCIKSLYVFNVKYIITKAKEIFDKVICLRNKYSDKTSSEFYIIMLKKKY